MRKDELVRLTRVRGLAADGTARKLRLEAGLSLGEVAEHVGVGIPTVSRWEQGERRPRGRFALRYGALLEALAREHEKAGVP
jgi:transcriptional regulator with XRE-family HTH domain